MKHIVEKWERDFPKGNVLEIAEEAGMPAEFKELLAQKYDVSCKEWTEYEPDEEELEEFLSENPIAEYYKDFLGSYTATVAKGHTPKFSYFYAWNLLLESSESRALEQTYHELPDLIETECAAIGESLQYTKRLAEGIRGSDLDPELKARQCEDAYKKCISMGHSEIYAERCGWEVSCGMAETFAHDFAYTYERLINGGMSEQSAWAYADDVTDLLSEDKYWIEAILTVEASRLAKQHDLDSQQLQICMANEYDSEIGYPDFDNPEEEDPSKEAATDILSGKQSLDQIKDKALKSYAALKRNSAEPN